MERDRQSGDGSELVVERKLSSIRAGKPYIVFGVFPKTVNVAQIAGAPNLQLLES